jgi:hypothetical protein
MTHVVSSWVIPIPKTLHNHRIVSTMALHSSVRSTDPTFSYQFSDDLLADMQHCLLTLERRVREGPGSLNHDDVDSFAMASARILKDMKADPSLLQEDRLKPGERHVRAEAAASAAAVQAEKEGKSFEEVKVIAKKAYDEAFAVTTKTTIVGNINVQPPMETATSKVSPTKTDAVIDSSGRISSSTPPAPLPPTTSTSTQTTKNRTPSLENESEGPAYDGSGFGVAKGTANTYFIEGMDEMTADEYQEALAQQVIERARQRRYGLGGAHGNRQTLDYMNSLSGGKDVNHMNSPKED